MPSRDRRLSAATDMSLRWRRGAPAHRVSACWQATSRDPGRWDGRTAAGDGPEGIVRARRGEKAVATRGGGGVEGKGGSVSALLSPTQASLPGMNRATRMHQSRAQGRREDSPASLDARTSALRRIRRVVGGVARRDSRVLREHRERVSASGRGTRCSEAQLRSACSRKPRGVVQRTREVVCRPDRSARGQTRAHVDVQHVLFRGGTHGRETSNDEMRRSGCADGAAKFQQVVRSGHPCSRCWTLDAGSVHLGRRRRDGRARSRCGRRRGSSHQASLAYVLSIASLRLSRPLSGLCSLSVERRRNGGAIVLPYHIARAAAVERSVAYDPRPSNGWRSPIMSAGRPQRSQCGCCNIQTMHERARAVRSSCQRQPNASVCSLG
jgi:hypothetical protein